MNRRNVIIVGLLALTGLLVWIGRPLRAATSNITGTFVDAQGNLINGTLTMQLPVPAQDTASNTTISNRLVSYRLINGSIVAGPPLYDVAGLQPQNLYYIAKVYDTANNLILQGNYVVTGASFNIGAATPTNVTTSNISYVTPVTTSNPNTFTAAQTFSTILSATTPTAATGFIRHAFTDQDCWRNVGNSTDYCIGLVQSGANINFLNVNGVSFSTAGSNSLAAAITNNALILQAGPTVAAAGSQVQITASSAVGVVNGAGGNVVIGSGGGLGTGNSGDIIVNPGTPGGTGSSGNFVLNGRAFANLGTPPSGNGSLTFCSDCTVANPCAGGGTGAIAKRLNSVWVCN